MKHLYNRAMYTEDRAECGATQALGAMCDAEEQTVAHVPMFCY